jgi:putative sigma-54 modulation protein
MEISLTFRNMDPSDSLKDYATQKITRLKKYILTPVGARVVLTKDKYRYIADIQVTSNGIVMRGEENSEDMCSAIDLSMDKIERQARKFKDKNRDYDPVKLTDAL